MRVLGNEDLFADFLQLRHPTRRQMTILQHNPSSFLERFLDHSGRNRSLKKNKISNAVRQCWNLRVYLALTKRNPLTAIASKAAIVGKFQQASHGIGAGGENEDQRSATVRIGVAPCEIKRGRFNVTSAHVLDYKFLS